MGRIVILGYGKMGRAVESACKARGISPLVLDSADALTTSDVKTGDAVIEFTNASACLDNYRTLIERGASVVTGTTGWLDHESDIRAFVQQHNGAFLQAANFSIGVQLFWKMIERAASLFDKAPAYDAFIHEIHHPHKKDSPSGTALHTARLLLEGLQRKTKILSGDIEGPLPQDALHIGASRGGYQAGEHTLYLDGPDDTITLTHHAKGRDGFANGAIDCALWIGAKKGYFTIDDYMKEIFP